MFAEQILSSGHRSEKRPTPIENTFYRGHILYEKAFYNVYRTHFIVWTQELEAANADLDRALHVALAVHQEDAHARSQLQV